jgi:peptidyl-prolyl cis-trans isomerase C
MLLAGIASLLTLAACNSTDTVSSAAPAGVAATVNGTSIQEHLVGQMLKERARLGRDADAEARSKFIDRLVMQVVITEAALKKGLDKQPDVADKLEMSRLSILTDAFVEDYRKNNPISDDALKAEYEKFLTQDAGSEYKAKHILVDNEVEAQAIIEKLKANPKAFEDLAKEKSKDNGSKARGGDLGWFDPRSMVPEFGKAVAQLAKGKFTETPVKSSFGYHVILLDDSRVKVAPPLEQVKTQFADQVQRQNLNKLLDDMKAKANIVVTPAPAPASAEPKAEKKEAAPTEPAKK